MNVPLAVGVPLIVMVLLANDAVMPEGNPVGVPIPEAPMVVIDITVIAVFTHPVVVPGPVTVLSGFMLIVTKLLM